MSTPKKCTICGADATFATKPTDAKRPVPRCRKHTNTKEAKAGHICTPDPASHEQPCPLDEAIGESKLSEDYARSQGFTSQAEMRGEDWS